MKEAELLELFHEISTEPTLSPEKIPALNLYIDQILTLFSTGNREEKALTKAMVNNYSKEKLIRPIKGKKYSREQVLQLLLICRLKSTLNMEEIKALTTTLMAEEEGEAALETVLRKADAQKESASALAAAFAHEREEDPAALILELCQLSQLFANAAKQLCKDLPKE